MLAKKTLTQVLDLLEKKEITLEELHKDLHAAVAEKNETLNVYLTVNTASAEEAAQRSEAALRGIPIAVKDNYCTKGIRTTASSTVLDTFVPPYDSTVIANLKKAGASILGKTNLDAWAHGSSTETSQYGRTLNPRNTNHLPGGSSGGSAAAVAADMAIAALGTETAGSIRQPAAWCGIVGLKPTYGRCSRYGVVAMASSTDSPGPMTKTVEDAALLLNHMAGHDKYDGTTADVSVPDFTQAIGKSIKGLKIGYVYHSIEGLEESNAHLAKELEVFKKLGATVEKVEAMDPHYAISVYTVVQRGEVSSNLGRYDGIRYGNVRSLVLKPNAELCWVPTHSVKATQTSTIILLKKYVHSTFKTTTNFLKPMMYLFHSLHQGMPRKLALLKVKPCLENSKICCSNQVQLVVFPALACPVIATQRQTSF